MNLLPAYRFLPLVAFTIFLSFVSVVARAAVLEEIIVTAQKRSQNVQDIGIAITAITGEQMEALGYTNAQQVSAMAPGVSTVQPNGEANYSIAIRGVSSSDFTTNVESPVAVYLDEVYISQASGTGFALFDMQRVEILRGPQGTLFGRNATGGLVHFVSRKPSQDTDGYVKVTAGEYNQIKFEGALGGALSESLSARLSVSTHHNDGYITNRLGKDLNNANDKSWRLQLLATPSAEVEFLLSARGSDQNIRTGFFENVSSVGAAGELTPSTPNPVLGYLDNDGDVFAGDYDDPGYNDLETSGISGTLKWGGDNMTLTAITDFSSVERIYIEDSDASPISFFNFYLTTDVEQFSQEIRLDGETDKLKWVTGLYYLNLDINDSNGAITDPFAGPAPTSGAEAGFNNPYNNELKSSSLFGQVEFSINDRLSSTLGLRVIRDERNFNYAVEAVEFLEPDIRDFNDPANLQLLETVGSYAGDRKDTDISTRAQLDWTPNNDLLVYAGWNRGVKGGNFNAPVFPVTSPLDYNDATLSYGPEKLDAYEVGFKWSFAEGLARLNGATYYYDYADYQAFNIIGIDTLTSNAEADSKGYELELQASPNENLDLILGVAWNDIDVTLADDSRTTSIQSPEWNANALLRYQWHAFGGTLAIQGDMVYRSEHLFALIGTPAVTEDGYTVSNASLTYTAANENWTAMLFVNNVTDEEYLVQTFDLSTVDVFGITEQYYGRPQWWGASIRYAF